MCGWVDLNVPERKDEREEKRQANELQKDNEYNIDWLKVFARADTNKNGMLDPEELKRYLITIGLQKLDFDAAFKAFDPHSKKGIAPYVFVKALKPQTKRRIVKYLTQVGKIEKYRPDKNQRDLSKAFKYFDHDGNGTLEFEELKNFFKELGMTVLDVETAFESFDVDLNGRITMTEFLASLLPYTRRQIEKFLDDDGEFKILKK